jgi:flagellar biosynthesis/type III secretory pathway protein FliH|tara:strand:- start:6752 stop:7879 length:1128 start_codon:yes stop_codon:yes gene_type:complete
VKVLSNSNSSVSWRLNGLLRAREKAKAFAATSWSNPGEAGGTASFTKWQPKVLSESGAAQDFVSASELNRQVDGQQVDAEQEILDQAEAETQAQAEDQARQDADSVSEAALEQAKREAFEDGYQRGLDEGESQWANARDSFAELTESLRAAQQDMTSFYDPIKKLSLHLAEQLVRGELSQSSAVIERLITEALKDVEQQGEGPVILYLNPMDKEKFSVNLEGDLGGELQNIDLRADPKLSQGSVRVSIDDSAIEDLLEHRLDSLAQSLLGQPMASSGSAFENNFANPVDEKIIEGAVEIEDAVEVEDEIESSEPINEASSDSSDKDSLERDDIDSPEPEDIKSSKLTDKEFLEPKNEEPPKPTDDPNSEELNSDD